MALFSRITLSSLQGAKRLEAEYYQPSYMTLMSTLRRKPCTDLGRLAVVTDGVHGSIDYDENSQIYCLSAQSVREGYFDLSARTMISHVQHQVNLRTSICEGDVIISSMGTIGLSAVAYKDMLPANAVRQVLIVRPKIADTPFSYYLAAFLNSKYGMFQSLREATGNVQQHLFIDKTVHFHIPRLSIEDRVGELYRSAERKLISSIEMVELAERLLLTGLGLKDWRPSRTLTYVRRYGQATKAHRMDAEHFHPKCDELFSIVKEHARFCKQVRDFRVFSARGSQPVYVEAGTLRIINSRHILEHHLNYDNFERTDSIYWDLRPEARVFKGDILVYTTGANVGRANTYLDDEKALASNHVNILRVRGENQIYVGFVLNSIVGRLQTRKLTTGTAQAELYPSDIDRFLVPFVEQEQQDRIVALVRDSLIAQREAKAILAKAKRAVETAIEESEEKALELID